MDLKSLLDQHNKLPTIPRIVQQLIESFSSDDVSIDEIANQLAADPVLTGKLLRLANSAYFHVSRTIGSVDDALRMLGFVMVRNLVLGNGMVTAFRQTPGMDLKQFWRYNLYTACAARWLAASNEANADQVFTIGLMHGIGQLQMHAAIPAAMVPIDKRMSVLAAGRAELEKQVLGFHHGDVAAGLAKIWNFPQPIIVALREMPQPLSAAEFSEPAAWVHLGAWRARGAVLAMTDEQMAASYPIDVASRLGITPGWLPALDTGSPHHKTKVMPPMTALTEGLDAMIA
jgi:HD-like signal output (HDOD) protein